MKIDSESNEKLLGKKSGIKSVVFRQDPATQQRHQTSVCLSLHTGVCADVVSC